MMSVLADRNAFPSTKRLVKMSIIAPLRPPLVQAQWRGATLTNPCQVETYVKSLTCYPAVDTQYRREGTTYLVMALGTCGSPCRMGITDVSGTVVFMAFPLTIPRNLLAVRCDSAARHSLAFTAQLPPGFADTMNLPAVIPDASDFGPQRSSLCWRAEALLGSARTTRQA